MVVNFKDIHFYYLNYEGYPHRKVIMDNMLNNLGVSYTKVVNNIELPLRQDRIAIGHVKLLEQAINNNIFPFITMEDDITLINNLPDSINIPQEASFIFLGGSIYDCGGIKPNMYITDYDSNFYRSYYMLAPTPTIIPNLESAQLMLSFLNQALQTSEFCDIITAMHSKEYIYLTPKDGLYFYQDNYNTPVTKFLWRDHLDKYL